MIEEKKKGFAAFAENKKNKNIKKKKVNDDNLNNTAKEIVKSRQNKDKNIVWTPFPAKEGQKFSSQQMFLLMDHIDQILYTGSRYIGKSDALIASYLKHVGKGYNERWRGLIVRKTYKALQDVIKKAKTMIFKAYPPSSDNPVRFLAGDELKFVWKSGEELHFRSCKSEQEYEDKFHGQEYPFIGIDELASYEDSTVYDALMSCNRTNFLEDEDNPPVMMRATTNPYGAGRSWVKKYFIDPKPIGEVITDVYDLEDETIKNTRVAIEGHWSENPYADKAYIAKLYTLEKTDYSKFRAWLFGDWDVVMGGMFGDIWKPQVHMLKSFNIPKSFYIDRSYDDGTSDPYSCLFWAEATSDTLIKNSQDEIISIPKGSLILVNEIYGADPKNPKKGLFHSTKKIADAINAKQKSLLEFGLFCEHNEINAGPADYMIWEGSKVAGKKTIADKFKEEGISWKKSKKHGANFGREASVRIFQDMLIAAVDKDPDTPHFYVFDCCRNFITNVINLQRDDARPDDIDQRQADHDWDACRYRVTRKRLETSITY